MKILALLLLSAFIVACSRTSDNVDETLTTEIDGSTLVIKREGVPIARIVNHEDGFFAQVLGGDDKSDMNLYYYEDESSTLASAPEVVSRNISKNGEEWLITYDDKGGVASEGRLFAPNTTHNFENNKKQNKSEQATPRKPSD